MTSNFLQAPDNGHFSNLEKINILYGRPKYGNVKNLFTIDSLLTDLNRTELNWISKKLVKPKIAQQAKCRLNYPTYTQNNSKMHCYYLYHLQYQLGFTRQNKKTIT